MPNIGSHYLWDLYNVDPQIISFIPEIKSVLYDITSLTPLHIEGVNFKQFEPTGVTGIFLLSESHLSIHTWPENGYVAIDLFSCQPINHEVVTSYLIDKYAHAEIKLQIIKRGMIPTFEDISSK